jgi:transcriptional regulator with XRE-family HTH domain
MADVGEWDALGERVRHTRLAVGLSQIDLAKLVGLDRTMIAKIEAGTRRMN